MPILSDKQRYDLSIELSGLIFAGLHDDEDRDSPMSSLKYERMLVRAFACFFACNQSTVLEDSQEAKELCERLNAALYTLFDRVREKLNRQLQERFEAYYEATKYLVEGDGEDSRLLVPVKLEHFEGMVPFDAFVVFEKAFVSFACAPEDDVDMESLFRVTLSEDPMKGQFAYFLRVWDKAEKYIREMASGEA